MIGVSARTYTPKGSNEFKQINNNIRNGLAVGLEKGFWRFLNLDYFLDFSFEGGFVLYGKCFMVFGLCDLSADLHLEEKNIQKTKS